MSAVVGLMLVMSTVGMAKSPGDPSVAAGTAASSSASPPRIGPPPLSQMDAAQRKEYDSSVKGFGSPTGPRMPLLNSPDVLQAWADMQQALSRSSLPADLREISILTVAAHWRSEFEWYIHTQWARKRGIAPAVIEAIRLQQAPHFQTAGQQVIYDFTRQLVRQHDVDDTTYAAAWKLLGTRSLVDLITLIGHYTTVSMMLNANHIGIPASTTPAFGVAR